jgi:membrane-associated PAP2 superfamily phosphatase
MRRHGLGWATALVFVCGVLWCTCSDIDLRLSTHFYAPQYGWYLARLFPWGWLYDYGEYPAIILALGASAVVLRSVWWPRWACYRRPCLCVVLAVALGPGLLVNGLLKPIWGRPRPRQVELFGGTAPYHRWWQPAGPGSGTSFPAGHASMGFILVAATFLVPSRCLWGRRVVYLAGLLYGGLLGWARLVQGGHFLSDSIWAGALMCLLVTGLQATILRPNTQRGEGGGGRQDHA